MSLIEQIDQDFQQALKEQNHDSMAILRLLSSALKYERINKKADLTDDDVIKIFKTEIKKRKEASVEYLKGNRQDLADKELVEIKFIEKYLPAQMGEDEVRAKIKSILAALDDKDNVGKVMGKIMAEMKGQADGTLVRKIVEEELAR